MKPLLRRLLPLTATLICLASCAIVIYDDAPRWSYTLDCNGKTDKFTCKEEPYPASAEFSVPEFFMMDKDSVVFRFYNKDTGFKLQFANAGPFKNGTRYTFDPDDQYSDVQFSWLYGGVSYTCTGGWVEFHRSIIPTEAYTIRFEFDLSAPGSNLQIRNGKFLVYDAVKPRGTESGLR